MGNKKDPDFKGWYNTGNRPPTEEALFALQEKYLKKRDQKVWSQMFQIVHDYARSMVLKRNKGKKYLTPDIVEDKATGAALAFMTQYLNSKDFYVGGSFAGMINWKVIESLYKDYNEDCHKSINDIISESSNNTVEDYQERIGFTNIMCNYDNYAVPEKALDQNNTNVIIEVLEELEQNLGMDIHSTLLTYFYLIVCLRHPKNRHSKNMFIKNLTTFKSNNIIELTLLELRNRYKDLQSGN